MSILLKAFLISAICVTINCIALSKVKEHNEAKIEDKVIILSNHTVETNQTRHKRQLAAPLGFRSYDYGDYYGGITGDYNYDYYDWVCSESSCQLCNILGGECCDPDDNPNCFLPDTCLNNPCLAGGSCVSTRTIHDQPDFLCICLPGLTGKYCQITNDYIVDGFLPHVPIGPAFPPHGVFPPPGPFGLGSLDGVMAGGNGYPAPYQPAPAPYQPAPAPYQPAPAPYQPAPAPYQPAPAPYQQQAPVAPYLQAPYPYNQPQQPQQQQNDQQQFSQQFSQQQPQQQQQRGDQQQFNQQQTSQPQVQINQDQQRQNEMMQQQRMSQTIQQQSQFVQPQAIPQTVQQPIVQPQGQSVQPQAIQQSVQQQVQNIQPQQGQNVMTQQSLSPQQSQINQQQGQFVQSQIVPQTVQQPIVQPQTIQLQNQFVQPQAIPQTIQQSVQQQVSNIQSQQGQNFMTQQRAALQQQTVQKVVQQQAPQSQTILTTPQSVNQFTRPQFANQGAKLLGLKRPQCPEGQIWSGESNECINFALAPQYDNFVTDQIDQSNYNQ